MDQPVDGDMQVYLDQLRRLEALSAKVALPAHGTPIVGPSALFAFYVKHRLAREAKVVDALGRAQFHLNVRVGLHRFPG